MLVPSAARMEALRVLRQVEREREGASERNRARAGERERERGAAGAEALRRLRHCCGWYADARCILV